MKKWLVFLLLPAWTAGEAKSVGCPHSNDEAVTGAYYWQLVSDSPQRLPELTLFANMLPKGGDIHHHYSGAIYAETYLDWVDQKRWCIDVGSFVITPREPDSDSPTAKCVSGATLRKSGQLYSELRTRWSDKDYANHFQLQAAPDQQFFGTFGYFGRISDADYKAGLQWLVARAEEENVSYLETMLTSPRPSRHGEVAQRLNSLRPDASSEEINRAFSTSFQVIASDRETSKNMDAYLETVKEAAKVVENGPVKVGFQAYVSRNGAREAVFSGLYIAFAAAAKERNLIAGVNIVGPENGDVALSDYGLHMKMFAFFKQRFPDVRTSMHAGELAPGLVQPEHLRFHVHDAVFVAGANRIGHGVDIAHESHALDTLREMQARQIAVEVNLTSNEFILGVKNEAHPVGLYTDYGIPIVLSTDDPGVSRNTLGGEYLLYMTRYKPSYQRLKTTAYNSIHYSFLQEADKQRMENELCRRFASFEKRMAAVATRKGKGAGEELPAGEGN